MALPPGHTQVHSRPTEAWDCTPSCQPGSPRGGPYSRYHLSGPCRERTPCLCLLPVRETINLRGLLLTPEFAQGRRGGKWGGWACAPRSPLCSAKTEGGVSGEEEAAIEGSPAHLPGGGVSHEHRLSVGRLCGWAFLGVTMVLHHHVTLDKRSRLCTKYEHSGKQRSFYLLEWRAPA